MEVKSVLLFFFVFSSLAVAAAVVTPPPAPPELSPATQRAVREAENLSLLKDRMPACTVLVRTIKKSPREETRRLKEKLGQLSTYFYTDKGFQDYLAGKDLFEKQKFTDALDKLSEADEVENGNVVVLHYLALAQLWSKKEVLADASVLRGLQINPFDAELLRDDLAVKAAQENWPEAIKSAKALQANNIEATPESLQHWGVALVQTGYPDDGGKLLALAKGRDQNLPEPYYWLGTQTEHEPNGTFLAKYIDLCKAKVPYFSERDPRACIHLAAAEKLVSDLKIQEVKK